jgi:hypothetical protein
MKLLGVVALLAAGTVAWAGNAGRDSKRRVMVCLSAGGSAGLIQQGEAAAARILRRVGIMLDWRTAESSCTAVPKAIVVNVSQETPDIESPGALGYATPFEGTHVVVFYDRVMKLVNTSMAPYLLGHVLAHEIVHMLQGSDQHSTSGVMKAHWSGTDYADMQQGLKFTEADILLIDQGLEWRATNPIQLDVNDNEVRASDR